MNQPILNVKNLKVAEFASEETLCFEATVYVDGRPYCIASNEGRGGPNNYYTIKPERGRDVATDPELAKRLSPRAVATHEEAERANEAEGLTTEKLGWDDWSKAYNEGRLYGHYDEIFDWAVDRAVHRARVSKDLKRVMGSRVLFTKHEKEGLFETRRADKKELAAWLADPAKLTESLKAKEVLNLLPFDEALELFLR